MLLRDQGHDVIVLEARHRVGGRTKSGLVGGATFDQGGQWVGPTQTGIMALADALGVERFATYCRGKKSLEIDGAISTYRGAIPSLGPANLLELHRLIRKINKLARTVPRGAPQTAPRADELDALTVAQWQSAHIKRPGTRAMVDLLVQSILSEEPSEVSMLYLLHYIHCAGGVDPLATVKGGGQEQRFVLGAQTVCERMASALGERVVLGAPVERIAQDATEARLYSGDRCWSARRVIVSAPPPVAARIEYHPPLPPARARIGAEMRMGDTLKCLALYERPFWREAGYSGETLSHSGLITFGFDNSAHDTSQPALVAFVTGARARGLRPAGQEGIRAAVLAELSSTLGPQAEAPTHFECEDWHAEPWSSGGPVAIAPPGTLSAVGAALREPVGRVHWTGTETSDVWCGFMEGAVHAAERVATEIQRSLDKENQS